MSQHPRQTTVDHYRTEYSIEEIATGRTLIGVGDRVANQERLSVLEREAPGEYQLVQRYVTVEEWEPVRDA